MADGNSSYNQIVKATGLFGGVQVVKIIIQIVRAKFIAVLLGPAGMGIAGLLNSTITLVSSLTSLGLASSAVKNIASANSIGDPRKVYSVITVFRRLIWLTGLLGSLILIVFATKISVLTFGNENYRLAFIWVSISLLLNQLSNGQLVLLQGLRKLNHLAQANVIGSLLGVVIIIPIYYFYRLDGIVPAIIVASVVSLLTSWFFSSKIKLQKATFDRGVAISEAKNMVKMGVMISLGGLMGTASAYLVRIYISNRGGLDDVGLYTAGFSLVNSYVGMIFSAMGTDYYPRLSEVSHDKGLRNKIISEQSEIALLFISPIIAMMIAFVNPIILLLYSSKFLLINEMVIWAAFGMIFKALSWSIAFILLAKGESKLFFITELIGTIITLCLNILGYKYLGLQGLGLSFLVSFAAYLMLIFVVTRRKFELKLSTGLARIFIVQLVALIIITALTLNYNYQTAIIFTIPLIVFSAFYSYFELNKRLNIKKLISKMRSKLNR